MWCFLVFAKVFKSSRRRHYRVTTMLLEIGYGLVLTCAVSLIHVKCGDDQRSHWYSRYGPVDYGRDVSLGTFQGSLSRLGCSRLCSDTDSCQSFQHFSESGKPICYTYTSYTHSRLMVPPTNANYMYYEKVSIVYSRADLRQ